MNFLNYRTLNLASSYMKRAYRIFKNQPYEVTFILTNRCNSNCSICFIWNQMPKYDLSIDLIRKVLDQDIVKGCNFGITGGEPLLHPNFEKILELFNERGLNYTLFSNCILDEKLIETVKKYFVKNLAISLDGRPETQKRIRGIDNVSKIVNVVEQLKKFTKIKLHYTVSNNNTNEDFLYVMNLCDQLGVLCMISFYDTVPYFNTQEVPKDYYYVKDKYYNPYLESYYKWKKGKLKLPCLSTRGNVIITSAGDVLFCQGLGNKIGNLYNQTLEQVWNSKEAIELRKQHISCNLCWLNCHRPADIVMNKILRVFPKNYLNKKFGEYNWKKD